MARTATTNTPLNARGVPPPEGWKAGQLVRLDADYRQGQGNKSALVARIVGRTIRRAESFTITLVADQTTWWANTDQITYLHDQPVSDPEPALYERRSRLIRNLADAASRLSVKNYDHYRLLNRLRLFLMDNRNAGEHAWFWQTIAESADNPRQVSYAARIEDADDSAARRRCSWKKLLEKARDFGTPFTESEERTIANLIGQQFPSTYAYSFEVVDGMEIYQNYKEYSFGSCMSGYDYPKFYGINPQAVSLVVIKQGHKVVGRALLWTANDGSRIVDRCYPSDAGPQMVALHNWASEQGYDYKVWQSYEAGGMQSERRDYEITMNVRAAEYDAKRQGYPFMDTFKYAPENPATASTVTLSMNPSNAKFESTSGRYTYTAPRDPNLVYDCWHCGTGIPRNAPQTTDGVRMCEHCFARHTVMLDYTGADGRDVHGVYLRGNLMQCSGCRAYRLQEDTHFDRASRQRLCSLCEATPNRSRCGNCHLGYIPTVTGDNGLCPDCQPQAGCRCDPCQQSRRWLAARDDALATAQG